jgi:hypothetical protein
MYDIHMVKELCKSTSLPSTADILSVMIFPAGIKLLRFITMFTKACRKAKMQKRILSR